MIFDFKPEQLAQSSLALQIGGMFSSAIGGFYSSKSQKSSLQFQSDMAAINAQIAEQGAQSALNQGQQQVAQTTLQAGRIKSGQRAALAANGVDLGEGNAAEVVASTEIMKEIDKNTITANAVRSAFGYRTQAVNSQNEALMKRATASGISPFGSAASSLLGSAGNVASSWMKMGQMGLFNAPSTGGIGSSSALRGNFDFNTGGNIG